MSAVIDFRRGSRATLTDADAELGVIGAALYDRTVVSKLELLQPHHFADEALGRAWAAIAVLTADGAVADPVTVTAKLGANTDLRDILFDAWDRASPQVAEDYAKVIVEMAQRRSVSAAATAALECLALGASAVEVIGDLESALLATQKRDRRAALISAADAVDAVLADLDADGDATEGVLSGIEPLDEHMGRMQPEELILLAGRPGMGKSALGACIALNVARTGKGVIEINSEMSTAQMMRRHLSDLAFEAYGRDAPTYKDIKRKQVSQRQRAMLEEGAALIRSLPLAMVKRTGLTLSALRSLVRRQAALWEAQGIALGTFTMDHVGLLMADDGGRDRYTDQTNIAIGLKALAGEFRVPIIAMAQLNRKVEDRDVKRPMLSDLRDTGAWEENADTVIGAYREAYYALKEPEPKDDGRPGSLLKWQDWDKRRKSKSVEAILLKVREGEETTISLWASIGHNAIRGAEPRDQGGFL